TRQSIEWITHVRMLGSPLLLPNGDRTLVERLRLSVLTLLSREFCQSIKHRGHLSMLGSQVLLPNAQRSLVERFGFPVAPPLPQILRRLEGEGSQGQVFLRLPGSLQAQESMRQQPLAPVPGLVCASLGKHLVQGGESALKPLLALSFRH